jgi:hypothetical protein
MAKKVWYSNPLDYFWSHLYRTQKKHTPEFTDEQIYLVIRRNLLNSGYSSGENDETRNLMLSGWELWRDDSVGELLHVFFLDKQLREFLIYTKLSDLSGIRNYLYENGKSKSIKYFKTNSQSNIVNYTFGLHIPYEKSGYAFSLSLFDDGNIELYFSHGEHHGVLSDKLFKELNTKKDEKSIVLANYFRLAINTIAYIRCFPDCVSEGVPKISDTRNQRDFKNPISVEISPDVIQTDSDSTSKIPHFRKGFFRELRSDYFTNKQGQIVYVSETMVKGKAKTVALSSDLEKFE